MNKTDNKHPVQLQAALIPVCKMVMRFGLHFNEFVRNLQQAYIHAAEEILEKSQINPNLQAIAIKTGMDRRTISEHKNNIKNSLNCSLNKMDLVIKQIQIYSEKKIKQDLSLIELQIIIDSIYAKHIRSKAIIKELLANKIITSSNNDTYKLNLTLDQQLIEIRLMADEVDYTAKRLFQTYYKNMFESNEQKIKLSQETSLSTKIPLSKHKQVSKKIHKELKLFSKKVNTILSEHESNLPENTYPEIGVTHFQFNSSDKENSFKSH
ncbi:MAG: hypothetical protein AB8B80_06050 [Marinicellaceae bacterium]